MQEEKQKFCPYCGAPVSATPDAEGSATCRASCTRKLRGLCDEIVEKARPCIERNLRRDGDGSFVPGLRSVNDSLWEKLAQPVLSPDRCVQEIGNTRVVVLLSCMFVDPSGGAAMHNGLDRGTYEKLVDNKWCERDEKLHNGLCQLDRERADKKGQGTFDGS